MTLSFERALVGRAIALLNLFRLTGGFISAPGVEHTIGSRAQTHLHALDPATAGPHRRATPCERSSPAARCRTRYRSTRSGTRSRSAIGDAYLIVLASSLAGIVAIGALLIATHVKLRAPDLAKFR